MKIPTQEEAARLQEIKSQLDACGAAIEAAKGARASVKALTEEARAILRGGPPKKRAVKKPKTEAPGKVAAPPASKKP